MCTTNHDKAKKIRQEGLEKEKHSQERQMGGLQSQRLARIKLISLICSYLRNISFSTKLKMRSIMVG